MSNHNFELSFFYVDGVVGICVTENGKVVPGLLVPSYAITPDGRMVRNHFIQTVSYFMQDPKYKVKTLPRSRIDELADVIDTNIKTQYKKHREKMVVMNKMHGIDDAKCPCCGNEWKEETDAVINRLELKEKLTLDWFIESLTDHHDRTVENQYLASDECRPPLDYIYSITSADNNKECYATFNKMYTELTKEAAVHDKKYTDAVAYLTKQNIEVEEPTNKFATIRQANVHRAAQNRGPDGKFVSKKKKNVRTKAS